MKGDVTGMKERINGILFAEDGEAALEILREIYDDYDLEPVGFEPAEQFQGMYLESKMDGFCKDCAEPYEEGDKIWWLGAGKGAWCEGCKKADDYLKAEERRAEQRAAKTGGVR